MRTGLEIKSKEWTTPIEIGCSCHTNKFEMGKRHLGGLCTHTEQGKFTKANVQWTFW